MTVRGQTAEMGLYDQFGLQQNLKVDRLCIPRGTLDFKFPRSFSAVPAVCRNSLFIQQAYSESCSGLQDHSPGAAHNGRDVVPDHLQLPEIGSVLENPGPAGVRNHRNQKFLAGGVYGGIAYFSPLLTQI